MIHTSLVDFVTALSATIDAFVARIAEVVDPESEAKTNDEMLGVAKEVSYEGLTETEEAMMNAAVQTSLTDIPLADPSAVTVLSEVTPGTKARDHSTTPGTHAQTDGATV
ncbi:hypothetical protein H5410_051145 [Solanum commersonii]|uniref:Polyprotein protein n=1 Tax=Solanum commersonii TaxID=4109 RepID=A0A9J5WZV0_SOLCO|nr:hypothetical protein H5410_051145 [Solanum commersonii]